MKKTLSFLIMLCMLVSVMAPMLAIAEPSDAAQTFWLTHYNDGKVEGSGVIFTETDTAGGWWLHVAFAPIEGVKNAYEIVDITNGIADGTATPVAVPEGGFVWAANYGNDYISLGMGDVDYTSPNCTQAITRAFAWSIGDRFLIEGVDFETVPTTTPDVLWYEDAYVCTSTITPYGESSYENHRVTVNVNETPRLTDGTKYVLGDWNDFVAEDVCLVQNPACQKRAMEVALVYDLGEIATVDSLTLYFYYCAWVMIGYPEGSALVEVSADGEVFESIGTFDITPAYVSLYNNDTVATTCSFEPTEARVIRATVIAGGNREVLGDAPTDGKFFWEFLAVTEVEVGKASQSDKPAPQTGNLAAGKPYTAVGLYPDSNAPTYPDEGGVTLTDGVISPAEIDFADPVWVGFNAQSDEYSMFEGASVVIDLGETKVINNGVVHAYKQTDVGITVPYGVRFSVSDDGRYYREVGCVEIKPEKISEGIYDIVCDFYKETTCRYVKVDMFLYGWGFVSEIELYCNDGEKPENTTNLALGKDVLHAQINGENASYNADLTDGIASDMISYDGEWFAYYYNMNYSNETNAMLGANSENGLATPAIDLGTTCKLDRMRVNMFLGNESGVVAPYVVYAEVSADGLTYSQVGAMHFASAAVGDTTVGWVEFDLRAGIEARYVRFHMAHRLNWIFINEIEVYGEESAAAIVYGDVNGDGTVGGDDAVRLMNYLTDFDYEMGVSSVEISAGADCNGDGVIDGRDSVRLLRYLAGYNPSTGESSVVLGPNN